jgi:predicted DNA-binding protein (MmcQ/YjbR family)
VLSGAIVRTLLQLFNHDYFELLGAGYLLLISAERAVASPVRPRLVLRMADVTWQELLAYCLAKPGAWQDEPWEGDVVVKVGAKIFAFLGSGTSVGVKCGASREAADEWLLQYPDDASVMAYIGRSGWNTLRIGGAIPDDELSEAIDASYAAIVAKLPKKDRPA